MSAEHFAGILVTAAPGELERAAGELADLPGVTLHHRDPEAGRLVAVLETADRPAQQALLRRILALPAVRSADLVYHLVDEGNDHRLILEEGP